MRVAYILSLVRQELDLRFRFIRLPAHVGLIITGNGLPTFVAHNDHFKEYPREQLQGALSRLGSAGAAATRPRAAVKDARANPALDPTADDQFLGELATVDFIQGPLDAPFALSDVPKAGKTTPRPQRALWDEYQKIAKKDVFRSRRDWTRRAPDISSTIGTSPSPSCIGNGVTRPSFRSGIRKHRRHGRRSQTALKANGRKDLLGQRAKGPAGGSSQAVRRGRANPSMPGFQTIHESERALSRQLRDDPKLQAKVCGSPRGGKIIRDPFLGDVSRERAKTDQGRRTRPAAKFDITQDIEAVLQPPFIPMPEKAMANPELSY
jgi:hypothetical protein